MKRISLGVAAAMVVAACGGGGGAKSATPTVATPAADTAPPPARPPEPVPPVVRDPLLGMIPHDTPYLLIQRRATGGSSSSVTDAAGSLRDQFRPLMSMVTPDMLTELKPHERMLVAGVHMFLATDDAGLERIGLLRPDLRFAFYGVGLSPVLRLEIAGTIAQEQLAASAKWAQVPAPFGDWHGHTYAEFQLTDNATVVAVFSDHQVAIGFGRWDPLESTCRHASLSIL